MKNENEIKNMELVDQQKLVIDLKRVPTSDKFYARAQQLIQFTEALKGYKNPKPVEVKNIAGHDLTVDDRKIEKDATVKLYPWQFAGLARFFEEVVEKTEKAAALLIFAFLFAFGLSAHAQNQTSVIGSPGQYWVRSVAGLNGGTNVVAASATNSFTAGVTNAVITTNANWSLVNGQATNNPTYTTNNTINYPGIVPIANYDGANLTFSYSLMSSGTGTSTAYWDYSPDLVLWQLNKWSMPLQANGTTIVTTNTDITGVYGGYIRLNSVANTNAAIIMSNLTVEVSVKSSKTGP